LDHKGGNYLYRIHEKKTKTLVNGFSGLTKYLDKVFNECPDEYFNDGPRSSTFKYKIHTPIKEVVGHEVCTLAKMGLEHNKGRYKQNHPKVQMFMIEYDDKTIAIEVPLWIHQKELEEDNQNKKPITGHIDLLRIEDGKIWIWDYKPNAQREKFAAAQVYLYARMLSERTKIPLKEFRCGYFDHLFAYLFEPEEVLLPKDRQLKEFLYKDL